MAFIDRMEGQNYIDKTRQYLDYLEEHLENVRKAFCELSIICDGMMWVGDDMTWHSLRHEVTRHDLSKFSEEEFVQYRKSFYPVEGEEPYIINDAWEHHKTSNHHHHETAESVTDIVHMIVDWMAMGYKFGGTAQEYYEKNLDEISINPELKEFMYEIFDRIKDGDK